MSNALFPDDVDVVVDNSDLSEDVSERKGGLCNKKGWYHVVCEQCVPKEEENKPRARLVPAEIVAASEENKDQVGRKVMLRFNIERAVREDGNVVGMEPLGEKPRAWLSRFFVACGLMTWEQVREKNCSYPFSRVKDCQLIVKVTPDTWEKTDRDGSVENITSYKVQFDNYYHLDEEEVKDVPRNPDWIELLNKSDAAAEAVRSDEFAVV